MQMRLSPASLCTQKRANFKVVARQRGEPKIGLIFEPSAFLVKWTDLTPLYCSLARDWHFWHCLSFNFQIELNRARSTVRPGKSKLTCRQYLKSFGIFLNVAFGERGTSKAIFGALSYRVPWITPNKGEREVKGLVKTRLRLFSAIPPLICIERLMR